MDRDQQLIWESYLVEREERYHQKQVQHEVENAVQSIGDVERELTPEEEEEIEQIDQKLKDIHGVEEDDSTDDEETKWQKRLNRIQDTLDVTGLASLSPEPVGQVTGAVSDVANVAISITRGAAKMAAGEKNEAKKHALRAVVSSIGLVPYVGDAAAVGLKAARATAKGGKGVKGARHGWAAAGKYLKSGGAVGKKGKGLGAAIKGSGKGTHVGDLAAKIPGGKRVVGRVATKADDITTGAKKSAELRKLARLGYVGATKSAREVGDEDVEEFGGHEEFKRTTHKLQQAVQRDPKILDMIQRAM